MARIAGIDLPIKKRIEIALTYVHGIGRKRSQQLLTDAGINPDTKVEALKESEVSTLRGLIEKMGKVEGDLRRQVQMNIKRLKDIDSYRGNRHAKGLPARGQRTKVNSRTVRGNVRRTAGSGRKPTAQKT